MPEDRSSQPMPQQGAATPTQQPAQPTQPTQSTPPASVSAPAQPVRSVPPVVPPAQPASSAQPGQQALTTPRPGEVKSAIVAGILGLLLGTLGIHDFYLGEKKKGIIHLCLAGSGLVLTLLANVVAPMLVSDLAIESFLWFFSILGLIAMIAMMGNSIWALIESITILTGGDAALAAKGYNVVTVGQPVTYAQPGAAQTMPQTAQAASAPQAPQAPAQRPTPPTPSVV